ncbi:hypothetical protein KGA66_01560 [Actinocrinis puniceicyclus]|uniref:Uncharacterized protein n=1 Tax=Actinocrinis puniceicyclus TaxID=977794 RepID=A0A8J8BB44_9ACTN|nr:hypothetical protein [Actinocrinis puniceicyclus]MBS2961716.1 hypothetical protein [Actinocrinis puniceicyclus]
MQHTGMIAAMVAVFGFAVGSYAAYRVMDKPAAPPILLRQATEPDRATTYNGVPVTGGVLVLLRNDGTSPVKVIDAAFSRTSAAPPLYIAPQSVPPGGEVNVYVPVPGRCFSSGTFNSSANAPPVRITVGVQRGDGSVQFVPVEVTSELAQIMAGCGPTGHGG